jgi:ribosome maturation factor RimP
LGQKTGGAGRPEMPAGLEPALENVLAREAIELVDTVYRREGPGMILRVFVDAGDGATIDICARATRLLQALPEVETLAYDYLEVSSPGLDRILKKDRDFERFSGRKVKVKCGAPFQGRKQFIGVLGRRTPQDIELILDGESWLIPCGVVASVRLQP